MVNSRIIGELGWKWQQAAPRRARTGFVRDGQRLDAGATRGCGRPAEDISPARRGRRGLRCPVPRTTRAASVRCAHADVDEAEREELRDSTRRAARRMSTEQGPKSGRPSAWNCWERADEPHISA